MGNVSGTQVPYASSLTYDDHGARNSITYGNGAKTIYSYHPSMRWLQGVHTRMGTSGAVLQNLVYTHDALGNVTSLINDIDAPADPGVGVIAPWRTSQTFDYDELYQLKTASGTFTGPPSVGTRSYTLGMEYDDIGNITRKNQSTTPVGPSRYDWSYTYPASSTRSPHAPATVGTQTLSYDPDGNLTSSTGSSADARTLTWDEEDRLKRAVVVASGITSDYLYGADGERSHKLVGGTQTYYINANYVVRPGQQRTKHITIGSERIASVVVPEGTAIHFPHFYHSDHLQSTNYVTDALGNLVQHNEYFPHGEVLHEESRINTVRLPYLFNAKELDESKLYYFSARHYDPRSAQWQSPDPILANYMQSNFSGGVFKTGNLGLYSYALNNPIVVGSNRAAWSRGIRGRAEGEAKTLKTLRT